MSSGSPKKRTLDELKEDNPDVAAASNEDVRIHSTQLHFPQIPKITNQIPQTQSPTINHITCFVKTNKSV